MSKKGFSLIELSIVLIIIGLIINLEWTGVKRFDKNRRFSLEKFRY